MFGWLKRKPPAVANSGRRAFDAAMVNRLTASWLGSTQSLEDDLKGQLDRLRGRSRDAAQNNEYAARFLRMVVKNIVGPEGFTLQARAMEPDGQPDNMANNAIEWAWHRWCKVADVTGRRHFNQMLSIIAYHVARDGEALFSFVHVGAGRELRIRLIDPQTLDTTHNTDRAANGNRIVMGVEVDENDRTVAYWFRNKTGLRERVPAAGVVHVFLPTEAVQHRGYPWLAPVLRRMHDLNGYREAAVIAARVGAAKMGIWEAPDGEPPGPVETDSDGRYITDAEPGTFDYAPPGYKLHTYDPAYPHDQFDAFCKAALRGIAAGLDVAYNTLANDLEGVNFSSIRSGVLDERDSWMMLQQWFIHAVLEPVYMQWIGNEILAGRIIMPNGSALPERKLPKFEEHVWQPRRWQWVDPLKDMNAAIEAINAGLASPQQIAAQQGRDIEDVLDDLQRFQQMLRERGISLPGARMPTQTDPDD